MKYSIFTKQALFSTLAIGMSQLAYVDVSNAQTNTNSTKTILDGSWRLSSMEYIDQSGRTTPWCAITYGALIYKNNYMYTTVNCANDLNKSFTYSGPFTIQGQTVFHHAQKYSHINLKKVHKRNFKFKDRNHLILSGALGDGFVVVRWVRK